MKVDCPGCKTTYRLARLPSARAWTTCKRCGERFLVEPPSNDQDGVQGQARNMKQKVPEKSVLQQIQSLKDKELRHADTQSRWYKRKGLVLPSLLTLLLCFIVYGVLTGSTGRLFTSYFNSEKASDDKNKVQIDYFGGLNTEYVTINNIKYKIIDDYIKWVPILYSEKNFIEIEKRISSLLEDNNEQKSYELQTLYTTLSVISDKKYVNQMHSVLNEWCKKQPNSHIPWLVRGSFYIEYAWLIRGGGFAKTVKKAAWPKFQEKLRQAKKDLERAWKLNPNDPNSSSLLIEVAIGLSLPRDVMEQYFQQGISACPWHYELHRRKLRYLKPKWYGSTDEMFSFAEQCLASSRQYPYLGLVMVDALHEAHKHSETDDNFLGREDIWPTVEKIYAAFFEKYPEDIRRHFFYAYHAIQAMKYDTALEQFETIGDSWMEHTLWDSLDKYNKFRAYAYVKTGENLLFKKKIYEISIDHFQKALKYYPDDHAYSMLGEAYACSGVALKDLSQLQEAEKNFKKAIELKGPYCKYAKAELKRLRKYMNRL